jgi:hypothetical protein
MRAQPRKQQKHAKSVNMFGRGPPTCLHVLLLQSSMPSDSHQKDTKQLCYSNRERPEKQMPCDAQSKINSAALTLLAFLPILPVDLRTNSEFVLSFFKKTKWKERRRGSRRETQPQPVCPSVATLRAARGCQQPPQSFLGEVSTRILKPHTLVPLDNTFFSPHFIDS